MFKHLTDSERLHILEEYLGCSRSKYNIARCLINDWLHKFELEDKITQDPMKHPPFPRAI